MRPSSSRPAALCAVLVVLAVLAGCSGGSDERGDASPASTTPTAGASSTAETSASDPADTAPVTTESAGTAPSTSAANNAESSTLDWSECDDQPVGAPVPLECATLTVPRDYSVSDDAGDTIEIAVARFDTALDDDQIGSLVFNPGGPGGSGIEYLESAVLSIPAEVQARFDLVSFDPRGVGASTAFDCDIPIDDEIDPLAAGDDAGWEALLALAESTPELCPADAYELASYIGTNNAARDLDALRAALGDEQLTYVGYSYGTRLGATYAELFPENVRALVLDGAVKPTSDYFALGREQTKGFDRALENFAAACDTDPDCLLREIGPTIDVIAALRAEIAEVGSFATDDPDRVLEPGELDLGILAALYSKSAWPFLAQGLYLAETEADGSLLQVLGDPLVGRKPDGTYDNSQDANSAINCADDPARPAPDEIRALVEAAATESSYFTDLFRADTGCIGLPDPLDPLLVGPATGAAPILVIGNTGDPATPYEWSQELAEFLDSGVLYTVEAEGHTAYGSIDCVADAVNSYLIDLAVPEDRASCSDNAGADFFVPAGEGQIDQILALFDCLREQGLDVPEVTAAQIFADPSLESFEFIDPSDPKFIDAVQACFEFIPEDTAG